MKLHGRGRSIIHTFLLVDLGLECKLSVEGMGCEVDGVLSVEWKEWMVCEVEWKEWMECYYRRHLATISVYTKVGPFFIGKEIGRGNG